MKPLAIVSALSVFCACAVAADNPAEIGAHLPSQVAADLLRSFAGTDGAFFAAGLVKEKFEKDNLATLLQYPTDQIVVVNLTGAQLKQAFERSVSLFPQPNTSFLQISGFEIKFLKNPGDGPRVQSITAEGVKLDESKTYSIAMPSSLGRGGLGYFKIWDKTKIKKTFENKTVEDVLRDKKMTDSTSRWIAVAPSSTPVPPPR